MKIIVKRYNCSTMISRQLINHYKDFLPFTECNVNKDYAVILIKCTLLYMYYSLT